MKPLVRIHDLYVGRVLLLAVAASWLVLIGLDALMAMVTEFSDIGKGRYTLSLALLNVTYSLPRRAYMLFPTAAVIGALLGLGQLAATSELTALRALGLSRRRLSLAVAMPLMLLITLMALNGETLAPWAQRRADLMKASAKSQHMMVAQFAGVWAREGNVFLHAQSGLNRSENGESWLELHGLALYAFDPNGRLASIARARVAEHRAGGWILRDVLRTTFGERSAIQRRIPEQRWESRLDPTELAASVARPRYLTTSELSSSIDYRRRNGLEASEFEELYWGRWFYPLNVLALCLAALPFAFGSLRSGGLGKRLFIGIVFALGFWLVQTQCVKLAAVYGFDYRLAYLLPPLSMLLISHLLFRRRR